MIELVFYQRVRAHLDHVCQNGILKAPEKYIENSVAGPIQKPFWPTHTNGRPPTSRHYSTIGYGRRCRRWWETCSERLPDDAAEGHCWRWSVQRRSGKGRCSHNFFILKPRPLSIPIHHGDRWTPRRAHDALDADPIPVSCLMPHGNGRVLFTPGTPRPEKLTNESYNDGWQPGPHVHNEGVAGPHRM